MQKDNLNGIINKTIQYPLKIKQRNKTRYSKYLQYMHKFTKTIPVPSYEYIYTLQTTHLSDNMHVFITVRYGDGNYVEMNSNTKIKKCKRYNVVSIVNAAGIFKEQPPRKILLSLS